MRRITKVFNILAIVVPFAEHYASAMDGRVAEKRTKTLVTRTHARMQTARIATKMS